VLPPRRIGIFAITKPQGRSAWNKPSTYEGYIKLNTPEQREAIAHGRRKVEVKISGFNTGMRGK
jgi:hypothetical protein